MREGALQPEPEVELLPHDQGAEDARFREEEAKREVGVAELIAGDIRELEAKGDNLTEEEKGRLGRSREAHAEALKKAEALWNQK